MFDSQTILTTMAVGFIYLFLVFCLFKGDVSGSLVEFDKAIELDPRQKACRFVIFSLYFFVLKNLRHIYSWNVDLKFQ